MSREYRPSVIYAKPNKQRTQPPPEQQRPKPKYDTRSDAYRLYQDGRQSRPQDHYVYDNRRESEYRKPAAHQDHHNSHLVVHDDRRQSPRHAEHDHYNPQYKYPSGQHERNDDPRYPKYAAKQDQRYLSDNRKYALQPLDRHGADAPRGAPHPGHYKHQDHNPLKELFQPPEGHQSVHAADVHHESAEDRHKKPPEPPQPPQPPVLEEQEDGDKRWKPRKIREYRIFRKNRKDDSSDSESSSDEEEAAKKEHKKERGKKKGKKKEKPPPDPTENWYTQTHPAKFIKLGDISYVRAKSYDKKSVEHLMSAFEAFGFVVIGILYKGGDAVLKVIAPIAAIKAYTALLTPALQGLVGGVTGGVVKGLGR